MMRSHGRETATYRRGQAAVSLLVGVQGLRESVLSGEGASLAVQEHDFTATAADLVAAGLWPPQVDDEIELAAGSGTRRMLFRVVSSSGLPPYQLSDEFGVAVRIHTARVLT